MINKGVAIKYGDVAPEAKENFNATASESTFDTLEQLKLYNLQFTKFANPCELYSVVLDGEGVIFPTNPEGENFGLWSEQASGDDGVFAEPIELELVSDNQYSSPGLTLTFDYKSGIFATHLKIKWIRSSDDGISVLDEKEFFPNSALYFCNNRVDNYNKIVITFYSINMPQNRLKLHSIDYGYGTFFYGDELRNVKLIQEVDPISSQISINTADFTIDSRSDDIKYSFQAKQPLSIYFDGKMKATAFVKKSKQQSKYIWNIQGEDYIGLMDSIPYYGGIYTDADAMAILDDIFAVAKIPYKVDDTFVGAKVSGYIPYTTCRDALMQVAFAIQAVVDTSNSELVNIFKLDDEIKQTVPLDRIMQGQKFTDDETVTSVELTAHSYRPTTTKVEAYNAKSSGSGNNIFVKFNEPLHDLIITDGDIIYFGANYAVINAGVNCVLEGQGYDHTTQTKRKNNPVVLASEIEKVVAIDGATLVSSASLDTILEKCYNWLVRVNETSLKVVEGKHVVYGNYIKYGQRKYGSFKYGEKTSNVVTYDKKVNVGDFIEAETEYLGIVSGRIIKQTFNLNGNIIVKEVTLK